MSVTAAARLLRQPHRPAAALQLWDGAVTLAQARVHELCGAARRMLALRIAAAAGAPVIWIAPAHAAERLHPAGVAAWLAPQALVFVSPDRAPDTLWAMEEALRSGAAPLVVADLAEPPGMTPVRRLHLAAEVGAAETGAGAGFSPPLGLLLTPGTGGAPGIETRWRIDPAPPDADESDGDGAPEWRLERLRARMLPPAAWRLRGDRLTRCATDGPARD